MIVPMIAGPPPSMGALETDLIPTQADIKAATLELDAKVKAFASEFFEQLPDVEAQPFLVAWNQFVADWGKWRDAFFVDRWGRRNEVIAFRGRFNGLISWWKSLQGASTTVITPTYTNEQVNPPSGMADTVRWAAYGAIALAAAVALGQLAGLARGLGTERERAW